MDLAVHGRPDYAWRFLNRYLESTGDYGGLELLRFYEVYRAVVRAMVACIRTVQQGTGSTVATEHASCCRYLAFAGRATISRRRQLFLMHGYSGLGKTTVAQAVLESIGAIRVRSDVERKRLFGLAGTDRGNGAPESGIYDAETTRLSYQHLARLARQILDAGFPVLIDAASLKAWQRDIFRGLAQAEGGPFRLISWRAGEEVMYRRLRARQAAGSDMSEAGPEVLALQLENSEPLTSAEQQECLLFDSDKGNLDQLLRQLVAEAGL